MCIKLSDGTMVCGGHAKTYFCVKCGRPSAALCDWKMPAKKSGTCDAPVCRLHSKEVAPGKHLCPDHQLLYDDWLRRHPPAQGNLFDEAAA